MKEFAFFVVYLLIFKKKIIFKIHQPYCKQSKSTKKKE